MNEPELHESGIAFLKWLNEPTPRNLIGMLASEIFAAGWDAANDARKSKHPTAEEWAERQRQGHPK